MEELQDYASNFANLANRTEFKLNLIILVVSPEVGPAISLGTDPRRALGDDVSKVKTILFDTDGDSEVEVKMKVG